MRVVFDTVVFVRAAISPVGPAARVTSRTGEYQLVTSPDLVDEVMDVLTRPALRAKLGGRSMAAFVDRLLNNFEDAEHVEPPVIEAVCRDPDDDKLFACAVEAGADYIVSDDKDVLAVGEYRGVRTITTVEFERLLDEANQS